MEQPLRILIVDADEVDRVMVRRALKASGVVADYTEATDAAGAVAAAKAALAGGGETGGGFDCVLLNYHLPDMEGPAALRAVRAADPSAPVILLTGQGDEQLALEMVKAGAADALSKQRLSRDLLSHAVRHAVRLRRGQAEADRARVLSAEAGQRLAEETRSTEALFRISQQLAAELDVRKLVQTVTDEATALAGADFGAFFYNVLNDKGESYTLYTLSGAPREAFSKFPMPRNTDVFGPTFRGEGVVRSDDITSDARYGRSAPFRGMPEGHLPVRSYLAVPVVSRSGEVLGGLFFGHHGFGVFKERDEKLVSGIASQAAVAIDNARLYEALRAGERQYRFLAESIPQIVWTAAPDGAVDYFNQRWHDYTGLTPAASNGWGWKAGVHPDDLRPCADRWAHSVRTGATYEVEYRLRGAGGGYRWHLGRALPFRDPSGRIVKWFGTSTDIHDRRQAEDDLRGSLAQRLRAEEALRVSRERLDLVVESSALGFWYCDLPFDKLVWNDRCKEHFGLPPGAPVTIHTFYDRIHPEDREPTRRAIDQAILERTRYDLVYRTVAPDDAPEPGRVRWVRAIGRAFYDDAGHPVRFDGVTVDVTAQKWGEEELKAAKEAAERSARSAEAANAAKDQFLAVLSHELRTPPAPVLSTVQALETEPGLSAEVRGAVEMIKRNVELEARLIDDLLDLTRVAKGKLELNLQTVDAHEALAGAVEICRGEIDAKGLRLVTDLAPGPRYVRADAARLHQVFWNLIKNAVKFTPRGGTIAVRARGSGDEDRGDPGTLRGGDVADQALRLPLPHNPTIHAPTTHSPHPHFLIEVRDTGIGIEADVLPRIFDAFEQGERSVTRRFGGLGLGLAISRALIDMQGGTLTAASGGKGCGAVFTVELPMAEPPERQAPRPAAPVPAAGRADNGGPAASPAGKPGLRILLVEDHDDTARAMRHLLHRRGYHVSIATSMEEALDTYGRDPFDLIISDIGLSDGSGLDLIRHIRARGGRAATAGNGTPRNGAAAGQPVTAIALSGFGMEEDVARSREAGFFAHLTKPINWDLLDATIRRAVAAAAESAGTRAATPDTSARKNQVAKETRIHTNGFV